MPRRAGLNFWRAYGARERAARISDLPRILGMGYVRKEGSAVGSQREWAGGTATVVQLPI